MDLLTTAKNIADRVEAESFKQDVPVASPRPQASRPPGCITTPRPSLTSSCSSTTIYGCGSLTERQPRRTAVGRRGSGDASGHVLYATPGSQLAQQKQPAESADTPLVLGSDHPLLKQAYQNQ